MSTSTSTILVAEERDATRAFPCRQPDRRRLPGADRALAATPTGCSGSGARARRRRHRPEAVRLTEGGGRRATGGPSRFLAEAGLDHVPSALAA